MSKIPGVGELQEGVLERDPLDDSLRFRVLDSDGKQQVLKLEDVFADYVGHPVRLTIAFTRALDAAAEQYQAGLTAVSFSDLAKS